MIQKLGADKVGAFIGEPVMGAGGVLVPPASYWPEIQRICREYNILLIADEVICGFGRTGEWFGCDHYKIDPDFMTMAKGLSSGYLPISGVMVHDRIADTLVNVGGEFQHGFTYSGHPVSAAVALENINIMQREKIVETAGAETGPYMQARLRELVDHPLVGEVRGVGMMAAVELVEDKKTHKSFDSEKNAGMTVREAAWKRGLLVRATGDSMVHVAAAGDDQGRCRRAGRRAQGRARRGDPGPEGLSAAVISAGHRSPAVVPPPARGRAAPRRRPAGVRR